MKFKRLLSLMLVVLMVLCSVPMQAFAADSTSVPNAEVTVMDSITLLAGEYNVWNGSLSEGAVDLPLQAVMNFKANDTLEDALAGDYSNWLCDFYLTFEGMEGDSVSGDGSYLAGNYGEFGWIAIPTDGITVEEGVEYPIVSNYDANLTYAEICKNVKNFTAALYVNPEILVANPNMKVSLALKMKNPDNLEDCLVVGEPAVYTAPELYGVTEPKAEVTVMDSITLLAGEYNVWNGSLSEGAVDLPLQAVMNFKAIDTLEEAKLGGYADWLCDFYLTFEGMEDGSVSGDGSYLAGNYGTFGWISIPTDGIYVEEGVEYPIVSNYDANLTYAEICKNVKNFTAALYVNPEVLVANPDMKVSLTLKMTNPEDSEDCLVVGEPAVYTVDELYGEQWPEAEVTVLDSITLTAGGYNVWNGSLSAGTVDLPLQAVMNFKAVDTLEEATLGGFGKWICDFYLEFEGIAGNSVSGDGSYLVGNYGEFGWIAIPTDGIDVTEGVRYPVVTSYDPNLTYENICDYVKEFTAAIYIAPETLAANPDLNVKLSLQMSNPEDPDNILTIGDVAEYTADELLASCGYVAQNTTTNELYTDINDANDEAAENETVILLADVEISTLFVYQDFDLNGHTLTAKYVAGFGNIVDNSASNSGYLKVPTDKILIQEDNKQLPVNTANGYQFVEVTGFNYTYLSNKQQYVCQPLFEEYAHDLLLAGSEVTGVNIRINVSWLNSNGEPREQNFVYSSEDFLKGYINSYNPQTGKYSKMFTLKLSDVTKDLTYRIQVASLEKIVHSSAPTFVEKTEEVTTTENITIDTNAGANQASALVPKGTKLSSDATSDNLKLTFTELSDSNSNITLSENEVQKSFDVHIDGVSKSNTVPMIISVKEFAEVGLNEGNLKLYHVENGNTVAMSQVFTLAEVDAHNEFYYDPATGDVTMALATFSEITAVSNTVNAWNGNFDYSWYNNAVMTADSENVADYEISNADQLAAFSAIVGGMDGQTQDSFSGRTVKLLSDINLGCAEGSNNGLIFYPIGYYNSDGTYEETGTAINSGFYTFEGTFDGNGHTISNFYQNTWEMKGDNNYYDATLQYYRDGMGLFGKVYGGTVKNLTVDNFSSDGEYTTTGVIAAYADYGATFENIAITNCNPRVYNIGNGGIVGCVGWYTKGKTDNKVTFKNITVDNTNKISALWGSYDVACGGIVGQYYPTSGQTSAGSPKNEGIHFENCHVSAVMDVYNDVCANYQYYAYRYTGMMIGSIRENTTNEDGKTIPKMENISAKGCTVNYGDWNDYYYCEFEKNSMASYSEDYQFSRVPHSELNFNDSNGNGLVDADERASVTGCKHTHTAAEDKQAVYLPFHQLFTGYGWGVNSIGLEKYSGIVTNLDITEGDQEESETKFSSKFNSDILPRLGNSNAVEIGSIFEACNNVTISNDGVWVSLDKVIEDNNVSGVFTPSTTDEWENGTIKFEGTGIVKITIQDYNFCTPTVLYVEVVDAVNTTTATNATANNVVLLNDISSGFSVSENYTFYGNGFTLTYTGNGQYLNNGLKQGVVNVSENGTLDNLRIKASIYPAAYMYYGYTPFGEYVQGGLKDVEGDKTRYHYQLSAVTASDTSTISNCYIYGGRTNIFVNTGNVTIKNCVLENGTVANVQIQSSEEYTVTLEDVTTIQQQANATVGDTTKVMLGAGVIVGPDMTTNPKIVLNGSFKQYNWVNAEDSEAVTNETAKMIIDAALGATDFNHTINGKTASNLGIIYMNEVIPNVQNNTALPYELGEVKMKYNGTTITGKVYSLQNASEGQIYSDIENADRTTVQGDYLPTFDFDLADQEISYDGSEDTRYLYGDANGVTALYQDGEDLLTLDLTKLATIYKYTGIDYEYYAVCKDSSGNILPAINGVVTLSNQESYTLEFTVTDNIFYDKNGEKINKSVERTFSVPLTLTVKEADIKNAVVNITNTELDGEYTTANVNDYKLRINFLDCITITDYNNKGSGTTVELTSNISSATLTPSSVNVFTTASTITVTYTDGRVLTVNLSNISGSSSGTKTATVKTSGGLYFITDGALNNKPTEASSQNKCTITSVSFKGNSGSTVTNDTDVTVTWALGSSDNSGTCVTPDTLITLADGTQKRVDSLTGEENLLVWNLETGKYDESPIVFVDSEEEQKYEIVHLYFSDESDVKVISEHGFFDLDLGKYVYIDANNYAHYVGHRFVKEGIVAENTWEEVTLDKVVIETEVTTAWSPVTFEHLCYYTNGVLSMPGGIEGLFNIFEVDTNTMSYDAEQMQKDIETYGLFTYEDFGGMITEDAYEAFNGDWLKVAIGKGLLTWDDIAYLAQRYIPLM